MSDFEIIVHSWLAREHGDEIARATFGQLELRSGDRSLTLVEDRLARSNRNFVNLSAYDLAIWLANNWWRLRWEPERPGADWRMAHSLAAIGEGYVWPDVTLLSDGDQISIQAKRTGDKPWEPIRYLESGECVLSGDEFEKAIDSFIDTVLARLAGCEVLRTDLHLLWQELSTERREPALASLRRLEALAGFDAGTAPDSLIDNLLAHADEEGRTAVEEVVAEYGGTAVEILRQLEDSLNKYGTELDSASVRDLGSYRDTWCASGLPWEQAEKAARTAREIWDLNGHPVSNGRLTALVGASPTLITGLAPVDVPMSAARRNAYEQKAWNVVLRSRWKEGKRFDLCRLIADGLVAPDDELLMPATHAKTSRQKFQRAFAQEFLCPSDALLEYLGALPPEDEEIENAAEYFEVSPLLIRSKLANQGILPRF
jgi:hypothetical protein